MFKSYLAENDMLLCVRSLIILAFASYKFPGRIGTLDGKDNLKVDLLGLVVHLRV